MIRFPFRPRKAIECAAFLLKKRGGRMPYMLLVKLLYFVERESLERTNRPIIGDTYFHLPRGPILSRVLDLAKGRETDPLWSRHIEREKFELVLRTDPRIHALSRAEVEILKTVHERRKHDDQWTAQDKTHKLPEHVPQVRSRQPLAVEDILKHLGKSDADIEGARRSAKEAAYFDELFGAESAECSP